jgi:hypothetical protein
MRRNFLKAKFSCKGNVYTHPAFDGRETILTGGCYDEKERNYSKAGGTQKDV